MKTKRAIELAGGQRALAELLAITVSAISQWDEDVPEGRMWQLRVIRPDWFKESGPAENGHATEKVD